MQTNAASKNTNTKRIVFLDAMRGIAALMVVYFHYSTNFFKHYPEYFDKTNPLIQFKFGGAGVELFFIISGFVILMTLEKSKKLKDFIISRISRLYPPYWFAIILTSVSLLIFPLPHTLPLTLFEKLGNLLMFHTWIGIPNIDGVYWTLGLELVFYVIMAVLFALKLYNKTGSVVFWVFNVLFLLQVALKFIPQFEGLFPYSKLEVLFDHFTLRGYGSLFMAGMLFYEVYKSKLNIGVSIQIVICLIQYLILNYNILPEHCLIVPFFFLLFFLCTTKFAGLIENKALIFVGSISYSFYLIHAYIGYGLLRYLNTNGISGYLAVSLVFTTIFFMAWLTNKFVEIPFSKLFRNFLIKLF